jgi:beta-lactam-binding protein with PASTA domain
VNVLGDSVRRRGGPIRSGPVRSRRSTAWGWRRWVPALIAAAVVPFAIGYAVAVFVLFPPPAVSAAGVPVPRLVGLDVEAAGRVLIEAGLGAMDITRLPHPTRPAGTVVAQSPLPGQQLRPGAGVRLAVSSGVPRAVVPDVVGFPADRAETLLRRLGFTVAREEELAIDPAAAGRVLRTEPRPGVDLALPALVTIIVALEAVDVPPDTLDAR